MEDLALQVRRVDGVGVDDPERAHAGRGEVQRGGRAEPAGAEQQHAGVEELGLPGLADLGEQEVARVAVAALGIEHARDDPLVAAGLPAREAARERLDVLVSHLAERAGRERGARTGLAADDDRRQAIGRDALDARLDAPARHVERSGDGALLELVELAHVDHEGRLGRIQACLELASVELADL